MSVICSNALNEVVNNKQIHQPDLILNEVRNMVTASFKKQGESTQKDGMDIALVRLLETNGKTTLQFAGANNPLWIVRKGEPTIPSENTICTSTHHLIEIKADKQPIGNYEKMNPFRLHQLDLQSGDTIYSFSDGYADQFGGSFGKKMKYKPLKDLILSIQDKDMTEQNTILYNAYNDWKRNFEQIDDVCMIGVRV
jgi:serine phosphatase RsbU (regulator of sigma subunit)